MQPFVLKTIHESHLGIVKCKQLARDSVYWPRMNAQIEDIVGKCSECQENRRQQQKEPLLPSEIPSRPWQIVAADLLQTCNRDFLVVIDYYSDFVEVEELQNNTYSITVIEKLAKMFAEHGKPEKLLTDNGPQFRSNLFAKFADDWKINHVTTSPHHHQANGKVERANQTIRHMIEKVNGKTTEFYYSLLQWRNTPGSDGNSPAQKLMSRRTATKLPLSNKLLKPQVIKAAEVQGNIQQKQQKYKQYFDRKAKPLEELKPADTVRVRDGGQWKPAKLAEQQASEPRTYNLLMPSGRLWRRNRRDVMKTRETGIFKQIPPDFHEPSQGDKTVHKQTTPCTPPKPPSPEPAQQFPDVHNSVDSQGIITRAGRVTRLPTRYRTGEFEMSQ